MCREGCKTKDHATWGECLRAANIHVEAVDQGVKRRHEGELEAYRNARLQGIQPAGTRLHQVEAAVKASDRLGRAYDAATMPL